MLSCVCRELQNLVSECVRGGRNFVQRVVFLLSGRECLVFPASMLIALITVSRFNPMRFGISHKAL
jgi:hypothetical protein